jgi:uncharacterized protein YecE (DUF72 family)
MLSRERQRAHAASVYVGTSGWVYKDWCGVFYPEKLAATRRLEHYAREFDTVEINATHYRLASHAMVQNWNRIVPAHFRMVAKGSAFITHRLKLKNCEQAVQRFFEPLLGLRSLTCVLWQFPQVMPRDLERLEHFLSLLPKSVRHVCEFRDPSFWADDVTSLLARYRVAFCAVSHPALPSDIVPTTDLLYVRFHGLGEKLYDYLYSDAQLAEWARRLRKHLPGRELYAFFNNDWHCQAIQNAKTLRTLLTKTTVRRVETRVAARELRGRARR